MEMILSLFYSISYGVTNKKHPEVTQSLKIHIIL